jgi:hypothetical protein
MVTAMKTLALGGLLLAAAASPALAAASGFTLVNGTGGALAALSIARPGRANACQLQGPGLRVRHSRECCGGRRGDLGRSQSL